MSSSSILLGASVAPSSAGESVRVSASSGVGGIGSNILWPSRLPRRGKMVISDERSFLANGGTTIAMGAHTKSFPAHPAFFQMSRHDVSHLISVVINESAKPAARREVAPRYFDATVEGEVAADFVDGLMESVIEFRDTAEGSWARPAHAWDWRPVSTSEHNALEQMFGTPLPKEFFLVPPTLTLAMQPQALAAYTVWDTICDNLKLSLERLPLSVEGWSHLGDFHRYAECDLAADIFALATEGRPSAVLAALQRFVQQHSYGLDLNYAAMFAAGVTAVAAWEKFFKESSLRGSMDRGFLFARNSRFGTAYIMSKCAQATLTCPVDAPTVQIRPEIYVDRADATKRFRQASRMVDRILARLQSNDTDAASQAILLRRLAQLGHIAFAVTLLPGFLQPEPEVCCVKCRARCGLGPG